MVKDLNICIKSEKISFVFVFRLKRRKSCTAEPLSPMGRVLIFFSGMRLSLSALLNIGNETSRGLVSVCLWFASFQHNAGRCRRSLEHLQSSCLLLINAFFFHESSQVSFIYVAQHHRSDKKKHFFSQYSYDCLNVQSHRSTVYSSLALQAPLNKCAAFYTRSPTSTTHPKVHLVPPTQTLLPFHLKYSRS